MISTKILKFKPQNEKQNWTISTKNTEITMKIFKVCTDFVGWSLEALFYSCS